MAADWSAAPCGLLSLRPDGTVMQANATFLTWTGRTGEELVGRVRLPELLSVGGRIYWETHLHPLLQVEKRVDEVSLELVTADGRLPVLLSAVVTGAHGDHPRVEVALSSARERQRFEGELSPRGAPLSAGLAGCAPCRQRPPCCPRPPARARWPRPDHDGLRCARCGARRCGSTARSARQPTRGRPLS